MYLINIYKDFKIWTQQNPEGTIFTNDNGGYSYTDGEKTLEFGKKEKLCSFLFRVKASYKDDGGNIRSMILGYDASCAALYEGRTLLDKYGNLYALDSTGKVRISGKTLVAQLPFGAYIIDWERNAEIEAERRIEEERQAALAAANAPKKKGTTPWWAIAAAVFGGAVLLGGGLYCVTKK